MKQKAIYVLGFLIVLAVLSFKFYTHGADTEEVSEQRDFAASWSASSAGSFIFN